MKYYICQSDFFVIVQTWNVLLSYFYYKAFGNKIQVTNTSNFSPRLSIFFAVCCLFFFFSVYKQATFLKLYKEDMKVEIKHVKR